MIPAILVAVVMIAGVFAFMPVEKASTVHGTLATSSGQTTQNTNIAAEADGQDRAISFSFNLTHSIQGDGPINATIIRGTAGETLTGYATLTAIPNNVTLGIGEDGGNFDTVTYQLMNCGLTTTGQGALAGSLDDADLEIFPLGLNATGGMTNFTTFSTANGLVEGEGIMVQLNNGSATGDGGPYIPGICAGTIILTNWGS